VSEARVVSSRRLKGGGFSATSDGCLHLARMPLACGDYEYKDMHGQDIKSQTRSTDSVHVLEKVEEAVPLA
jgi:hypothetical protein